MSDHVLSDHVLSDHVLSDQRMGARHKGCVYRNSGSRERQTLVKVAVMTEIPQASRSGPLRVKISVEYPRRLTYWGHNIVATATAFASTATPAEQNDI